MKTRPATISPIKILFLLSTLTLPSIATATSLNDATDTLCRKIKSCATAQLEQQDLPPAMLQMMKAMFDETCASMISPYADKATDAGLEKKTIACIESINTLSCPALMQDSGGETAECKALEAAANAAGINTKIDLNDISPTS
ncbi:hypothetical protein A9Q88_02320 [Gammaproteobacteria bacterium 50_400_T64]|nr:hypothetical protein A9Q88_02320 [Gammaproteobacteria bacterium 50_400_T64]